MPSLDGFEAGLNVIHDATNGDLARWVGVGGDALLNHVEEVVACCGVTGIICAFGGGLGGTEQGGEAQSSGCRRRRRMDEWA